MEDAANRHLGDAAIGGFLGLAAWSASPQTFLWMLPVIVGLAACIPIAACSAGPALGEAARRAGLLLIPEELAPPMVVEAFNRLMAREAA